MILQALAEFYETLAAQGKVPKDGWVKMPVAYEIQLNPDGTVEQIVDIRIQQEKGKPRPQEAYLPNWGSAVGSGIRANFLSGTAAYVLGLSDLPSGKEGRLLSCVQDAHRLHHEILDGINNPAVEALLLYFDRLEGGDRLDADSVSALPKGALSGSTFVFSFDGRRLEDIPEVQEAWDIYYELQGDGKDMAMCLVTGKIAPVADKHPFVKGLRGAQGSGAGISTYNADSFCSYGFEQNMNAPVSRHAAYAYTQALAYLLDNPKYRRTFGEDLTVVWWPEDANEDYGELMLGSLFGADEGSKWTDDDIAAMLDSLSRGRPVGDIEPNRKFYVMGLSPNSSRIIIRFFLRDSFGEVMWNVIQHYDRLKLYSNQPEKPVTASRAFRGMVREKLDELPEPVIRGYFESVMFGHRYPVQMFSLTHRRIQIDNAMDFVRTSLIKAYFLQTLSDNDKRKECFAVNLLTENTNPGYVLGRLFAVYEAVQNVGREVKKPWDEAPIHSTFASAMSTPATVFPRLSRIVSVYLPREKCRYYGKLVEEIKALLPGEYPKRLDLADQGAFDLGYYHQRQAMFAKKPADDSADESAGSEE